MFPRGALATLMCILLTIAGQTPARAQSAGLIGGYPQILMETSEGEFIVELDARRAPLTASHFVALVHEGFYDGTIFHRVIGTFVAQGGSHTIDYRAKEGAPAVVNESGNGLSNQRGTIAMARTDDPHSATASFYINLADNSRLDPRPDRWGYTVFGQVIEGMETLDRIAAAPTGPGGPFAEDVPALPIVIKRATRLSQAEIAERAKAALEAAEADLEALQDSE
ncbi:MAG: peptidylprolyl isomerase [Pseudomonadota bacterium]